MARVNAVRSISFLSAGVLLFFGTTSCLNDVINGDGPRIVYTSACNADTSVVVKVSLYRHLLSPVGDTVGYGLFFRQDGREQALYVDGYQAPGTTSYHSMAWYAGWRDDGNGHTEPEETNTFAPLPVHIGTMPVKLFEAPHRTYSHAARPPHLDQPAFMNIFLDPRKFSRREFDAISNCLGREKPRLDNVLSTLGGKFPGTDRFLYHPLRVGGVALGLPPYNNSTYLEDIKRLWGETGGVRDLPEKGSFVLFPDQSARGRVGKHVIAVTLDESDKVTLEVDGIAVTGPAYEIGDIHVLSENGNGWMIGNEGCVRRVRSCDKNIALMALNDDRSVLLRIFNRNSSGNFTDLP